MKLTIIHFSKKVGNKVRVNLLWYSIFFGGYRAKKQQEEERRKREEEEGPLCRVFVPLCAPRKRPPSHIIAGGGERGEK